MLTKQTNGGILPPLLLKQAVLIGGSCCDWSMVVQPPGQVKHGNIFVADNCPRRLQCFRPCVAFVALYIPGQLHKAG